MTAYSIYHMVTDEASVVNFVALCQCRKFLHDIIYMVCVCVNEVQGVSE